MSQIDDAIIINSDKQFRLRITGFLRTIGVSQIIGTKEYLDIEFIGGECCVTVFYPTKMEELSKSIEKELLAETQLMPKAIDNIRFYINDYVEEIESFLKQL